MIAVTTVGGYEIELSDLAHQTGSDDAPIVYYTSVIDSDALMAIYEALGRTPAEGDRDYFPNQRELNADVLWSDGLFGERIGTVVKKPMSECTGEEILTEFLYHLNMSDIQDEVLKHAYVSTCMMPYITSQFMPRKKTDRPRIVPEGCTNLTFIGQYVEVDDDVVFTIETSVRTPLEAVYMLTGLNKDIIEVNPSRYDIRYLVENFKKLSGIKGAITEKDLPKINPFKIREQTAGLLKQLNDIPPYYVMYPGKDKSVALKESVLRPEYPKAKE